MRKIDHIVYAVPHLETAMDELAERLGVRPVYGGKHLHQGTHNALLNVGDACYFELIAIDPENQNVPPPLWMGVNLITEAKTTRWAIKTDDLQRDVELLKAINPKLAKTKTGSRQRTDGSMLEWQLSIPLAYPEVELIPFLLDWKDSIHPTESMPQEIQLISIKATHPNPELISTQLQALGYPLEISKSETIQLSVELATPKGRVLL